MTGKAGGQKAFFQGRAKNLFLAFFKGSLIECLTNLHREMFSETGKLRLARSLYSYLHLFHQNRFAGNDDVEGMPGITSLLKTLFYGWGIIAKRGQG